MTLDRLAGGRAVLGVGLGEPLEEHTADGGIEPVAEVRVRQTRDHVRDQRSLQGYDGVVTVPGRPTLDDAARHRAAGGTWVLVTGWFEDLARLVAEVG